VAIRAEHRRIDGNQGHGRERSGNAGECRLNGVSECGAQRIGMQPAVVGRYFAISLALKQF
jgi:hypothetical protein